MKQIIAGILAHVDAGKTTLSEALLYSSGSIKKIGRVDNGDAFLDTDAMEKKRGITIFSKQAELQFGDTKMTLLDTPGHVDFSAEMERTLMVLDYAVLVISASDGVQAHTQTLWRLLKRYEIPVFLFINKMDQPGTDRETILLELKKQLSDGCIDFMALGAGTEEEAQENEKSSTIMEEIAMEDETAMESFLETGRIAGEQIREMIVQRKIFPCFFGSALRNAGVDTFLQGFDRYTLAPEYPDEFGMKVFKIARDEANNRLTYLKVTGGTLKVKSPLSNADHVRFGEEVLVDLTPLAQKNGITLAQTGENVQLTGSDVLLYRVLFNLTENAIKYNRTGGSVELSVEQEHGQAAIRVRDTGPGIAEEYRDSIFQPFFRVDKSRSRAMGGVGLGLALVQEIVRLHGGTVRVEQSADTGTTILVTLPVGKAA